MRGRVGINKTGRGMRGGRVRSVFAAFLLLCAGCGQAQPIPGPSEPTRAPVTGAPAWTDAVQATATSEPVTPSQPTAASVPASPSGDEVLPNAGAEPTEAAAQSSHVSNETFDPADDCLHDAESLPSDITPNSSSTSSAEVGQSETGASNPSEALVSIYEYEPELPISSCLGPSNAPSSTRAIVVSVTDAVNHPIKLTKPSLGVVS